MYHTCKKTAQSPEKMLDRVFEGKPHVRSDCMLAENGRVKVPEGNLQIAKTLQIYTNLEVTRKPKFDVPVPEASLDANLEASLKASKKPRGRPRGSLKPRGLKANLSIDSLLAP